MLLCFWVHPSPCYHGDGSQKLPPATYSINIVVPILSAPRTLAGVVQDALIRRGELSLMTRRSTIRNQTSKELSESKDNSFTSYQQPLLSFRFEIAASVP